MARVEAELERYNIPMIFYLVDLYPIKPLALEVGVSQDRVADTQSDAPPLAEHNHILTLERNDEELS